MKIEMTPSIYSPTKSNIYRIELCYTDITGQRFYVQKEIPVYFDPDIVQNAIEEMFYETKKKALANAAKEVKLLQQGGK